MATDNPRVTAYIQPSNSDRLKEYQQRHGLTVSQAIDRILTEYFTGDALTAEGNVLNATPSVALLENWQETVKEIIEERLAGLESRLGE